MKCRIQWIDGEGQPTPDQHEAVGEVRCLGYRVESNPNHKPQVSEWYPICHDHKHVMDESRVSVERGGRWEFRELGEGDPS